MKVSVRAIRARAFIWLQHATPKHLLTALVRRVANIRFAPVKDLLIQGFVRLYRVEIDEIERSVPDEFTNFNDFFTRELAEDVRAIDAADDALVSPVDGIVSAAGTLVGDQVFQAKGLNYRLDDLLATDLEDAALFENGLFATLYLAPYNYHRFHCPLAGELTALRYVPGTLYSVNDTTVQSLRRLFARNERLIAWLRTDAGPVCIVCVGALNVGSITTPWTGTIRPRRSGVVEDLTPSPADGPVLLEKGDLLGWFNMGSTVIVLLPPGAARWQDELVRGAAVTMGRRIGTLARDA